jgi:hypothetical protein
MTLWIERCQDEEKCNHESLWRSLVEGHGHGYGRIIGRSVGTFMMRLAGFILLGILSVGWSVPACAQPRTSGSSQSRDVRKAQKKQAKAQKKYAKAQKKAERKMLKTERKNTKYPSKRF